MNFKIFIATSIDGFISKENGDIEWLNSFPNPENLDFGFNSFINNIDCIIMGRNTFEKVLTFKEWPYKKKVYILSSILKKEINNQYEIFNDLDSILEQLKIQNFQSIYVDGGKTIQSFLNRNLLNELIISIIPTFLGKGISLFNSCDKSFNLILLNSTVYSNGIVKNHYKIIQN